MMIIARDRDYEDLRSELHGKNVMILTCSTCARLCYDLGGPSSAERLAERLKEDEVHVTGTACTSASCLESKLKSITIPECTDIILSLTCDLGAYCVDNKFSVPVLNPVMTYGCGILSENDGPVLITNDDGNRIQRIPLLALCGRTASSMPFV